MKTCELRYSDRDIPSSNFLSTFLMLGVVETIDMSFDSVKIVAVAFQSIFLKNTFGCAKKYESTPDKNGMTFETG